MTTFDRDVLRIDAEAVATDVAAAIRRHTNQLKRRGLVVGVSGGVDSAVCAALAVRAVGPDRVTALLMPEADSDPESTERGELLCKALGIDHVVEDIAPALEALGCYRRRDAAIRRVFPDFGPGWRQKIALAEGLLDRDRVSYFTLVVESPAGERSSQRMPTDVYLEVVAATNMKQRTRKLMEYFHAEARNYAVLGTPNRLEYELGFFVRGGDGLADLKPIAHLYKTQVYELARHLDVPEEISSQPPSTDTYSLPQTQEEFYFALPYAEMDLLLWAWHHGVPAAEAAPVMGLEPEQVERVYRDIVAKRRVAERSLRDALLVEKVDLSEGLA
ncbi:MAG TPA: NAD(+) synthase [Acidimicrobiales bacterium]